MQQAAVPRLGAGVKFQFDSVRGAWSLLAPERLFQPDDIAVEVLKLIDGKRSVAAIVDSLAVQFTAPRETIIADVSALIAGLIQKKVLRL